MTDAFFIVLYGLLLISGSFMLPAWLTIMRDARTKGDRDYAAVATALAINSLGTVIIFGSRLGFGFFTHNWASVDGLLGWIVLSGLAMFEISKIILMRVRHDHGSVGTWWAFAIVSLLWTAFAATWVIQ